MDCINKSCLSNNTNCPSNCEAIKDLNVSVLDCEDFVCKNPEIHGTPKNNIKKAS